MPHIVVNALTSWNVNKRVYSNTRPVSWSVYKHVYSNTRSVRWSLLHHLTLTRKVNWNVSDESVGVPDLPKRGCNPWPASQSPFKRLYIDRLTLGNTSVYFEMDPRFTDPLPWSSRLQYSESGLQNADDWINVGNPTVNSFYAVDPTQRLYGKQLLSNYRIKLTTTLAIYYSQPTNVYGRLNLRDWLLAREITRKELLRLQRYTATEGFLLIARRSGTPCDCLDPVTNEVINSYCPACYGTAFEGGYYHPYACTFFDLSPDQRSETVDATQRGSVDDTMRQGRFIGYPILRYRDVFVDIESDERYFIKSVKTIAVMRDVPIVVAPTLQLAPFTNVIYTFPVPR